MPNQPQTPTETEEQKLQSATLTGIGHGLGLTALFTAAATFCMALDIPDPTGMAITAGIVLGGATVCFSDKWNGMSQLKEDAGESVKKGISKSYNRALASSLATSFLLLTLGANALIKGKGENKPDADNTDTPAAKEITTAPAQNVIDRATYQYQPA